mmetsp:Transcript_27958/g.45807  ORF Transcript_27958/g.45807 Transcript_27958/m.45807 type:complete len:239 (-) Transcript_27958:464-1180(-)
MLAWTEFPAFVRGVFVRLPGDGVVRQDLQRLPSPTEGSAIDEQFVIAILSREGHNLDGPCQGIVHQDGAALIVAVVGWIVRTLNASIHDGTRPRQDHPQVCNLLDLSTTTGAASFQGRKAGVPIVRNITPHGVPVLAASTARSTPPFFNVLGTREVCRVCPAIDVHTLVVGSLRPWLCGTPLRGAVYRCGCRGRGRGGCGGRGRSGAGSSRGVPGAAGSSGVTGAAGADGAAGGRAGS